MAEWSVTPDYIVDNWPDDLFNLMVEKLAERRRRKVEAVPPGDLGGYRAPDSVLFARAKNMIEVIKK